MQLGNDGSEMEVPIEVPPWEGAPIDFGTPAPAPAPTQTGSSSVDWSGLIGKAIETWGTYEKSQAQIEVAKIQAQQPRVTALPGGSITYPTSRITSPYSPIYSPTKQQDDTLLYAGAATIILLAVFLSR